MFDMLLRVPLSVVVIGMEREAQRDFMVEEARDFEVEREEGEELTEVSWMNRRVVGMACVWGGGVRGRRSPPLLPNLSVFAARISPSLVCQDPRDSPGPRPP